jgi:hypothetical protein
LPKRRTRFSGMFFSRILRSGNKLLLNSSNCCQSSTFTYSFWWEKHATVGSEYETESVIKIST